MFFPGNERNLLERALRQEVLLVLPEDILVETRRVMERTFAGHPLYRLASERLEFLRRTCEFVERAKYARYLVGWEKRLRDPSDAPLFACAEAASSDGVITGDRDVLELRRVPGVRVFRTRAALDLLAKESP